MHERLLHALDLGVIGDWEGAKRALEDLNDPLAMRLTTLLIQQQRREREGAETRASARHELGNALSIAQGNIEAMIDGVLAPTTARLTEIREALIACGAFVNAWSNSSASSRLGAPSVVEFDICNLIAENVEIVAKLAASKRVRVTYASSREGGSYRGDPERVAFAVRSALIGAVRCTAPGGEVAAQCFGGEMTLAMARVKESGFSLAARLLDILGGNDVHVTESADGMTLVVRFLTLAVA